jgi:hypothetical protein
LAQCEKSLIFKKQRRKTYQKHMGHRQSVHMLRIDRIEHDITLDFFRKRREEDEDQREKGNL